MELERIGIQGAEKVLSIFTNRRRFGMSPNMALSINSDCEPLAWVKVLCSTLVMLYLAVAPACRAVLCAIRYAGFGVTRFTNSCASSILKNALESTS